MFDKTLKKTSYLVAYEEVIEGPNILETTGWGQNSEREKFGVFFVLNKYKRIIYIYKRMS